MSVCLEGPTNKQPGTNKCTPVCKDHFLHDHFVRDHGWRSQWTKKAREGHLGQTLGSGWDKPTVR